MRRFSVNSVSMPCTASRFDSAKYPLGFRVSVGSTCSNNVSEGGRRFRRVRGMDLGLSICHPFAVRTARTSGEAFAFDLDLTRLASQGRVYRDCNEDPDYSAPPPCNMTRTFSTHTSCHVEKDKMSDRQCLQPVSIFWCSVRAVRDGHAV